MANQVGYEYFYAAKGGTKIKQQTLAKAGAMVAIFYVSEGPVRYNGDGVITPTKVLGLPIPKGGHIILVGRTNIANAQFADASSAFPARIDVLMYDQVDIVAVDLVGFDVPAGDSERNNVLEKLHGEVKRIRALMEHVSGVDTDNFH